MEPFGYAVVRDGSPSTFFEGETAYTEAMRAAAIVCQAAAVKNSVVSNDE